MNRKIKKYIITGGSSGIGYSIAVKLLDNGHQVVITSRNATKSKLVDNKRCFGKDIDISNLQNINKLLDWIKKKFKRGKIDGLINCAGVGWEKDLPNVTEEEYEKIFSTNVKGLIFTTKSFLPFIKDDTGIILNISSIAGIKGFSNWSIYCASKYAVEGFTESLRHELRSRGIRVMSIRPGSVDTPFYKNLTKKEKMGFINPKTVADIAFAILSLPKESVVENIFINNSVGDL